MESWCKENGDMYYEETSALESQNIEKVFNYIAQFLVRKRQQEDDAFRTNMPARIGDTRRRSSSGSFKKRENTVDITKEPKKKKKCCGS